jgi:solute:Na+ symporter, SSS family
MTGIPLVAAAAPGLIAGVIGFLTFSLAIGIFSVRFVKGSSRRYIVAGKSLPVAFVGTMLSAQAIDGNSSLGNAAAVYTGGFWAGATIPLGLVICLLLTGAVFGKRLNKLSMLTLPDFYYRRYGASVEGFSAVLMVISFVVLVAGNFAASGFILERVLGVPFIVGMLIAALIILTYTAFGGLFSCAYTDIFQIYLAVIGFWAMFIYFAGGFSGHSWTEFMNNTPDGYLDLSGLTDRSNGALLNWATIVSLGIGDLVALDFMERVFSARDGKTAARGAYWGATVTLITVVPTAFLGIFALTILPKATNTFLVYPDIAINHVPTWIGILMCAGVLGAAMSTANGGILAISAVLSRNLIQRDIMGSLLNKEHMGNVKLLRLVRLMLIPVVGGGFLLAWRSPQPGQYLVLAFDIVLAGALVPLVAGLFWRKANTPAALACMLVGSTARLIGFWATPADWAGIETMIPPIIGLITFVGVALATQERFPGEVLFGIVDYVPPEDDVVLGEDLKGYKPTFRPTPAVG